jgi:ketosteroid isomerase-like protein
VAVQPADRAGEGSAEPGSRTAEFVEFFARGWGIGAGKDFFEHFESRVHPDALMTQPLAPPTRGIAEFRATFEPLFKAIPDLRGEVRSWGETHEGALIELRLAGHLGGRPVAWTTIDRIVLEDGLIKERHAYFDPLPLAIAMLRRPQISLRLLPTLFRRRRRS